MAIAHDSGPIATGGRHRLIVGSALIVIGAIWALVRAGAIDMSSSMVLPLLLLGVGIVAILSSFDGPHPGLVVLGAILSVIAVFSAVLPADVVTGGVGERVVHITSMTDLEETHELGMGRLEIDLTDLVMTGTSTMTAEVGMGSLVVIVPEDLDVAIHAQTQLGEIDLFGATTSGFDLERRGSFGELPDLVLELSTGLGSVEVRR